MAQFEPAFAFLMRDPGEDPTGEGVITVDDGGVTKYGISQRAYPNLDIRGLTKEQAQSIYRADYFVPLHGFYITNQDVANKLFDLAVNTEPHGEKGTAVKIFQMACGDSGHPVVCDGDIGQITVSAINACDPVTLLDSVRSRAKDHYCRIEASNPEKYNRYLKGWLRRAEK